MLVPSSSSGDMGDWLEEEHDDSKMKKTASNIQSSS
jgi:hypothetical protein